MLKPVAPLPVLVMAGHDPANARGMRLRDAGLHPHKALTELAGRPLIAHVVDALRRCPRAGTITLAGMQHNDCDFGSESGSNLCYLPNQPSLLENVLAGLRAVAAMEPLASHVLITGSDAPLLSAEAVTWFVDGCGARTADLYMAIVERRVVEAFFPGSGRTYLRTRSGAFCSGDLFLVRPAAVLANEALLHRLLAARKSPLRIVQSVGAGWALRFLLGRIEPDDLQVAARRLLGLHARPVILPFAGAAMDVDKPFQLELVRSVHAQRQASLHTELSSGF